MTDRNSKPQLALRDALIAAAQAEVERYLVKQIEAQEVVDRLIRLLDGPRQREVQRRAPEALAKG